MNLIFNTSTKIKRRGARGRRKREEKRRRRVEMDKGVEDRVGQKKWGKRRMRRGRKETGGEERTKVTSAAGLHQKQWPAHK